MKRWEQFWAENAEMIRKNEEQASGGGGGGGLGGALGGGGGFDPEGQMQTEGFQSYRAGERADYKSLMGRGLMGSGQFTDAEIKRGYRRLKG